VICELDTVTGSCAGRVVAQHARSWAPHRTITDLEHVTAAEEMRRRLRASICPRSGKVEGPTSVGI
jgi:hypothetical protein